MNLMESLPGMNWRRFSVLLKSLGPNSAFVLVNSGESKEKTPASGKKQAIKALAGW
jgi:hypothetical protein